MLSPTEAAARNAQIKLRDANKLAERIENATADAIKRYENPAVRSHLPTIEPSKRAWKRPPHVAKVRTSGKVAIATQSANYPRNEMREYLRGERD